MNPALPRTGKDGQLMDVQLVVALKIKYWGLVCVSVSVCGWINSVRNKPRVQLSQWILSPRPPVQLPPNESLYPLEVTNYPCQLVLVNSVPHWPLIYSSGSVWISSNKVNLSPLNRIGILMSQEFSLRQFITITCVYCVSVWGNKVLVINDTHRQEWGKVMSFRLADVIHPGAVCGRYDDFW